MPDSAAIVGEKRLDVWRRSLSLFDQTTSDVGPFHAAGYREYVLEPRLEDGNTPDIAATSGTYFVLCDVSFSANKDCEDLRKYKTGQLTPALRARLGVSALAKAGGAPFLLTTARGLRDFPRDLNAVNVQPGFDRYVENVSDVKLRDAFENWRGFVRPPPNYSLLALPESDPTEIQLQLAGLLKQRASIGEPLSAAAATEHLLGDLFYAFQEGPKSKLRATIADMLRRVAAYIDGASFRAQDQTLLLPKVDSSAGRKVFDRKLASWSGTPFIEQWYTEEEEDVSEAPEDQTEEDSSDSESDL